MATENYSEKVSVNINASTLSSIDLLVDNGYYSNRSDFINQALRNSLQQHQSTLDRIIDRNMENAKSSDPWFLGIYGITRRDIEESYRAGESYAVRGYGVLIIDADCPEEMVYSVIKSIHIKGKVSCSAAVRKHYGLK